MLAAIIDQNIEEQLNSMEKEHPFSKLTSDHNIEALFAEYLAMSQAFPYIQAGSQKELIFHCIKTNTSVTQDMEKTSVIGNFLAWDETGGHAAVKEKGDEALPTVMETSNFHSNLLRKDIRTILKRNVEPNYSPVTSEYLVELYNGLSNLDSRERVACMVAFETHAERMIDSLWESLSNLYPVDRDTLDYFYCHVGGDNPAEKYHVEMTHRMIEDVIGENEVDVFLEKFKHYYTKNVEWCRAIMN